MLVLADSSKNPSMAFRSLLGLFLVSTLVASVCGQYGGGGGGYGGGEPLTIMFKSWNKINK